jgi:hypothetical protein
MGLALRRRTASVVGVLVLGLFGALSVPSVYAASGGGCDPNGGQARACISEDASHTVIPDAYVNGGYSGCTLNLYFYEDGRIINHENDDCTWGGHFGRMFQTNVPTGHTFFSYATLNDGATSTSLVLTT